MRRALFLSSVLALAACNQTPETGEAANDSANLAQEAAAPGGGGSAASGAVAIADAMLRLPAVPGRPGAAYFTLRNEGAPLTLASASAERAERAEIHESTMEGGVMQMRQLQNLELPQGATEFASGGKHIMLFGLDPALKAGDSVPLTLTFGNGQSITVDAVAQAAGGTENHSGH